MKTERAAETAYTTPWIFKGGVVLILCLCAAAFILYAAGSGFSDRALIALLWLLQFLAVFLALLSLCALVFNVWRLARSKKLRYALFMGMYLLSGFAGIATLFFGRFIIMAAAGN